MAQNTSQLWKDLIRKPGTEFQYRFNVNGVIYDPDAEVEHTFDAGLYENFGIGNAFTASLTMRLFAADIPRAATIRRYVRLKNGDQTTEWLPKGIFFTNRRSEDDGYWTIEAYDSMRKAAVVWEPDQALSFPTTMPKAVAEFCRIMGVTLDKRTALNAAYTIDYPANDYTILEELQFIAAAHCGNWIITDAGELYLVPLLSTPPETNLLVSEDGDAIIFGGVRILV